MGVSGQRHAAAALPSGKKSGIHCIGRWVGPRAGLDGCGKYRPHRDLFLFLSFCPYPLCTFTFSVLFSLIPLKHTTQTSLPLEGFEPPIPASERPQTYGLNHRTFQLIASRCTN
jgi:hypothetical protein